MLQNKYKVIGVMSGTSLDGIDLAEVSFSLSEKNTWSFQIQNAETISYQVAWIQKLKEGLTYSKEKLEKLNEEYTHYLAEVIRNFIARHSLKNIDAVCSHGHTILHQPNEGITLQIGNLPKLARLIQQKVVCDFRVQDVKLGGQGAPLVPMGDQLLFTEYDYCLNLGGFANLSTVIEDKRVAYDICPVNIVLNKYAEKLGVPFDDKGNLAKSGKVVSNVFNLLQNLDFYDKKAPKSLGLEWVQTHVFPILTSSAQSEIDVLSTFTEHVAFQISEQFVSSSKVLITGGGAYNSFLLSKIKQYKEVDLIRPSNTLIEYKEALIFGLLGVLKLREEANCLASVTGAKEDHSSGEIYLPVD